MVKPFQCFHQIKLQKSRSSDMILLCLNWRDMSFTSATPCIYCIRNVWVNEIVIYLFVVVLDSDGACRICLNFLIFENK